jgi:hypothetical protein
MKLTVQIIGQTLTRRFICGRDLRMGSVHAVALRAMASADNGSEASGQQFRLFHPHGTRQPKQRATTSHLCFWSGALEMQARSLCLPIRGAHAAAKGRAVWTKDLSVCSCQEKLPIRTHTHTQRHKNACTPRTKAVCTRNSTHVILTRSSRECAPRLQVTLVNSPNDLPHYRFLLSILQVKDPTKTFREISAL